MGGMEVMGRPLNILLIDDNRDHARIIEWVFRNTGREDEFTHFGDGMLAFEYLKNMDAGAGCRPDLIFLDFNLPKLDGREVLRLLKEEESTRSIPVIVVSSSEREEDIKRAYELGASNYVSKTAILEDVNPMLRSIQSIQSIERPGLEKTQGGPSK
jgi:chemotaxis family two-component system response regulator Rcp1